MDVTKIIVEVEGKKYSLVAVAEPTAPEAPVAPESETPAVSAEPTTPVAGENPVTGGEETNKPQA